MFQAIKNASRAFFMSLGEADNSLSVCNVLSEEKRIRTLIKMSENSYWQEQLDTMKATSLSPSMHLIRVNDLIKKFSKG